MDLQADNHIYNSNIGNNRTKICKQNPVLNGFLFKFTKKAILMTEDDEEDFDNNNICQFFEKSNKSDKVRGLGHLTGKYRGPARSICNKNVKHKKINFIPLAYQYFNIIDDYKKPVVNLKKRYLQ